MQEFITALLNYPFLQHAVAAGALASIACGMTGTYVVVKRISFISGGIAHTVLGGLGVAYYYGVNPMVGAVIAALLAAVIIGLISLNARQHEDTIIGALWAVGMAVGIIFIARTPGYNVDLMSFLFGNILMVSTSDLAVIAVLDAVILLSILFLYKQFLAVTFDEEYAWLRGIPVQAIYLFLLVLVALTVVVLIKVVGLILVIALLTLPATVAGHYARSLGWMMILASGLGLLFTTAGLIISYQMDLPAGATIIVLAGVAYLVSLGIRQGRRRMRRRSYRNHLQAVSEDRK